MGHLCESVLVNLLRGHAVERDAVPRDIPRAVADANDGEFAELRDQRLCYLGLESVAAAVVDRDVQIAGTGRAVS
jgi:hypothetical protein